MKYFNELYFNNINLGKLLFSNTVPIPVTKTSNYLKAVIKFNEGTQNLRLFARNFNI